VETAVIAFGAGPEEMFHDSCVAQPTGHGKRSDPVVVGNFDVGGLGKEF
jgi:hypothetical protein